jgi:hypothetical protein
MNTDPRVSELLLDWQELRQEGQTVTAAELCADCPELAEELQRRMMTVDYWEQFLGTRDEEQAVNATPETFGKYRVVRMLGQGGQATTLLAFDPDLRCHLVLKVYHGAQTEAEQETVLREGQVMARVRSPYVARCYGVERQGGVPALVVEYVPGRNLREQQRVRPLAVGQALELVRQLAEGLAAVHACGLLHRDLKPANVILGDDGRPRLVDFGLASPLSSADLSQRCGTLPYLAPEQARVESERIDGRTDVYGLGAVLYELLTGRPPHQGATQEEVLRAACAGEVVAARQLNRRVPRVVNDLCQRCLAKDPSQRFGSAAELAGSVRRLQRWLRWRLPLVATAAALVLLGLAAILVVKFGPIFPPGNPEPPASRIDVRVEQPATLHPGRGHPEPLAGWIDVRVWKKDNLEGPGQWLGPQVMPFNQDDAVRVEAELKRPAYLYVVWLDTAGEAAPIYPWDKHWNWPVAESPVDRLSLPASGNRWRIKPGVPGMETLLLLARETPWPRDVDWRTLLADLPRPAMQDPSSVVWFRNWAVVHDEGDRAPNLFEELPGDPLLVTQAKLRERLQPYGVFSRAVSFANAGR